MITAALCCVIGVTAVVRFAPDVWLLTVSWREDRAVARAHARPGGIVAWEELEAWSDGSVRWGPVIRYAADEYAIRELTGTLTGPSRRNVQVLRDDLEVIP